MALLKTSEKPLLDRIKSLCLEAEDFVTGEALEQQKLTPGMPLATYRRLLEARAPGCACRQALAILEHR